MNILKIRYSLNSLRISPNSADEVEREREKQGSVRKLPLKTIQVCKNGFSYSLLYSYY